MYLERLPKEEKGMENGYKQVTNLKDIGYHIDIGLSPDLFNEFTMEDWVKAFLEHYNLATGGSVVCESYEHVLGIGMRIPLKSPRMEFVADSDHNSLKVWLKEEDRETRNIVCGFLERLIDQRD